ncbi:uncharacterized protein K02A2.6 [Trichonephila clavipes]|nr:uncharacterized protein K02A2.6 [Trichonephila clavipes]
MKASPVDSHYCHNINPRWTSQQNKCRCKPGSIHLNQTLPFNSLRLNLDQGSRTRLHPSEVSCLSALHHLNRVVRLDCVIKGLWAAAPPWKPSKCASLQMAFIKTTVPYACWNSWSVFLVICGSKLQGPLNTLIDLQSVMYVSNLESPGNKFLEIKQEQGEKFTDYYSRLRNAVVECNYGESQDRMLRDKLIQGLLDKALQERLIRETSKMARAPQEVRIRADPEIETPELILKEFADDFTGTGRLKRIVKIKFKENSVPHLAGKVPHFPVKFLVLPFGRNSAPEEFQKAMDEIYEDEVINPYFDDIALGSSTMEEHCRLLR